MLFLDADHLKIYGIKNAKVVCILERQYVTSGKWVAKDIEGNTLGEPETHRHDLIEILEHRFKELK